MLDDLAFIHQKDSQDALGIAERQCQQLETQYEQHIEADIHNVVFTGMGGSALAALLSQSWPGFSVPFEIVRQYDIPSYVNKHTLCIVSSYSGNTEETLEALGKAEQAGASIAVITSGGSLLKIAQDKNYPLTILPQVAQPRFGTLASLKALLTIAVNAGLLAQAKLTELQDAIPFLQKEVQAWTATIPSSNNVAKQLALDIIGKSPVIYGGPLMAPVAYKWKISFNENAKNVAWCGVLPEFNHNEFIGWSSHPVEKPYKIIDLRSSFEHSQITKRFEVSDRLLSGKRPAAHIVSAQGNTPLEHLLWTMVFGDFVSLYTALLNDIDPSPVDLIESFKKELA